jgi:hypothetical protein
MKARFSSPDRPRATRPETQYAARRFDQRVRQYARAGLCWRCAAQAAFGHVDGWLNVHPPCVSCRAAVESFPTETGSSSWRKLRRSEPAL